MKFITSLVINGKFIDVFEHNNQSFVAHYYGIKAYGNTAKEAAVNCANAENMRGEPTGI